MVPIRRITQSIVKNSYSS